jgi:hypothetical protein
MDHHSRTLVLLGVLLAGIAGLAAGARAELIEPIAPVQEPLKEYRPVPVPVPRPVHQAVATPRPVPVLQAIAIHRPSLVRTVSVMMPMRSQPRCSWYECNQFVIVGMGF